MTSNFTIFFIFLIISNFSLKIKQIFAFSYGSSYCFVNNFIFFFFLELLIFTACSVKDAQNFFMQSLPQYALWLFSMSLNDDIVEIEKPDAICSRTIVVDEFSGIFLHPSVFSIFFINIFYQIFKICINNHAPCFIRILIFINSNVLVSSEGIFIFITKVAISIYATQVFFSVV